MSRRPRDVTQHGASGQLSMLPDDVASALQLACLLEASAPKPGNVSPGQPFADTTYDDFLASAAAIGPALALAGTVPLGETILEAVRATRRWTLRNTNLGIILLLAPIARAALRGDAMPLRDRLRAVLSDTTIDDSVAAYAAIAAAAPGGLGAVPDQDIHAAPTVTLREAMMIAAPRDLVASEYATDFALTFDVGVPALDAARADGLSWDDATVECALTLLATTPDTLIVRKLGVEAAREVSAQAIAIRALGGTRSAAGREAIMAFDHSLRDPANRRNPGTTADLTAAALGVLLLRRFESHPHENGV